MLWGKRPQGRFQGHPLTDGNQEVGRVPESGSNQNACLYRGNYTDSESRKNYRPEAPGLRRRHQGLRPISAASFQVPL